MRRQSLVWVGVLVLGSAFGGGAWVLGQERSRVEVTAPAVPSLNAVAPSPVPSELSDAHRGKVYIGYRGAYLLAGSGKDGHAIYRDANNQFWANRLTYYGMNNGYWIAQVEGVSDTFLAFETRSATSEAPYFKILIHTSSTPGYVAWDEATRGNAQ
jgi:hypothetical protein